MSTAAQIAAVATALCATLAALVGAWRWYRVDPPGAFWPLARAAQAVAAGQALVAGVLAAMGFDPADDLFWLYALLPVAIGFIAEQLRIASAEQVLDCPFLLIGSHEQIVDELHARRERFGVTYCTIFENSWEQFAPVVSRLG